MLGLWRTVFALLFVWALGALALGACGLRRRRWPLGYAQAAMDFVVGGALLSILWTCSTLLGWEASPVLVYVALLVLAVPAGLRAVRQRGSGPEEAEDFPPGDRRYAWATVLAVALLAIVAVGAAANSYATPMFWDGRYIWAFKAKAIFLDGRLDREVFSNLARYRHTHVDYPLLVPSVQAWGYEFLGYVDERKAALIGLVYWAGLVGLLACWLRRRMDWPWALGIALLVCQVPLMTYHGGGGGADVAQAFCFLAGGLLLADWAERGRREDGVMSALMFGVGTLVKAEGLSMAVGGGLVFAFAWWARGRRLGWAGLAYGAPALLLPYLSWAALRAHWGIPSLQLSRMQLRPWPELWWRVVATARAMVEQFTAWPQWELAWAFIALGLICFLLWVRRMGAIAALWGLVFWQLAVYVGIYALSPYDIDWHLTTSLDRVLLHIMPLAAAAAAAALAEAGPAGTAWADLTRGRARPYDDGKAR